MIRHLTQQMTRLAEIRERHEQGEVYPEDVGFLLTEIERLEQEIADNNNAVPWVEGVTVVQGYSGFSGATTDE